ncbi:MAG: glycoside hydrolase family 71 protein, partial [Thiobacillaceae bacterium]|nr:glycoside hydrolase family 71 protein [Thiobacillaceae bacterium]
MSKHTIDSSRRRFLLSAGAYVSAALFDPALAHRPARADGGDDRRRWAFAHYMTGMCTRRRNQSVDDWVADIRDALAYGIDGWQFNFGRFEGPFRENVARFVRALQSMGSEVAQFRFFPSFDCNKGRRPEIAQVLDWFSLYYHHPNHFRLNGLPLFTVWQARHVGNDFFVELKRRLQQAGFPVSFIPWIATEAEPARMEKLFTQWDSMDGFYPWVPGKPAEEAVRYNLVAADLCRRYGKTLMAGQGFAMLQVNKAPIYVNKHGAECITTQMLPLVDGRLPDCRILNVATWNDFGEDHHITPYPPYDPGEGKYPVWGHVGYSTVLKYYLDWWKSGRQPELSNDTLVWMHMSQLAREGDPPFPYVLYQPDKAQDVVYVTAMLKAPASLVVTSGDNRPVTHLAPAGISHWRIPAAPGEQTFRLQRNGRVILNVSSSKRIASPPSARWT